MLGDALTIHKDTVGAVIVTQDIAPGSLSCDDGVGARNSQVFEEDVTLAAAPDGSALVTEFIHMARFFALPGNQRRYPTRLWVRRTHHASFLWLTKADARVPCDANATGWPLRHAISLLLCGWRAPSLLLRGRSAPLIQLIHRLAWSSSP